MQSYFPFRLVWAYLDGDAPGLLVVRTSATRRTMLSFARKGFTVYEATRLNTSQHIDLFTQEGR